MSYNSWLRDTAIELKDLLQKNTDRLQGQLSVLDSLMRAEQISSQRLTRVLVAEDHLMSEIHLLVTLMEDK